VSCGGEEVGRVELVCSQVLFVVFCTCFPGFSDVYNSAFERERESERETQRVCVCVRERERKRERER
jgi:hypothetical protein